MIRIYTIIGGPFVFILTPDMAKQIGQGLIDISGVSLGLTTYDVTDLANLKNVDDILRRTD